MKQFSKKLLALDYIITSILLTVFIACIAVNGIFTIQETNRMLETDNAVIELVTPFDLSSISIIIGAWVAQLGISSAAYYMLIKSEHKIELPMRLLNDLPDEIKKEIDLTQIITTVLSTTDN